MNGFERTRLLSELTLLAMALFVSGNIAPNAQWRRWLRYATITAFALAVVFALAEVAVWLRNG